MILIIDNYDSFVFNIVRYCQELGAETVVRRNNRITISEITALAPDAIIISPGPCGPHEAGISLATVAAFSGRIPLLGVCLGHQCIGEAFGGRVLRAERPMHGIASKVTHDGTGIFADLPNPLAAGRYHSLIVELTEEASQFLSVTARSEDGEIMALAHHAHPTFGVQFHPESILTEYGHQLIGNFINIYKDLSGYALV